METARLRKGIAGEDENDPQVQHFLLSCGDLEHNLNPPLVMNSSFAFFDGASHHSNLSPCSKTSCFVLFDILSNSVFESLTAALQYCNVCLQHCSGCRTD